MTKPLVSVLIPVYNGDDYLRSSVESILFQTYSNLEIFIIDDGSSDNCMDSISDIEDSRIRIITQTNAGRAVALNRGLSEMTGTFYATQDADDTSYPQRIERQVHSMLRNPDVAAVFTGHDIILGGYRMAPRFAAKDVEKCHLDNKRLRMPAHDPTGMFRVSMVQDIRYEVTLKIGAGLDYILRVAELHPMIVLGECLYSYRVHPRSATRQNAVKREEMIRKVLKRACERRGLDLTEHLPSDSQPGAESLRKTRETGIVTHFMESVLDLRRARRNRQALSTALACLRLHPCDAYYYKPLAYFLMPLRLIECYRSRKEG